MGYGPPWCGMGIALETFMWFCEEYTNPGTEEWQQKWPRALSLPETPPPPPRDLVPPDSAMLGQAGLEDRVPPRGACLPQDTAGMAAARVLGGQQGRRGLTVAAGGSVLMGGGVAVTRGDGLCNTHVTQVTPRGASCLSLPHCHCERIDAASLNECQGLRPFQSR